MDFSNIGKELKRLRTECSYTQEQVANDMGCTVSFISNIENNRTKVNLRVLMYYAELCNVTVDSILNAEKSETDTQNRCAVRDAEILRIFHQFSPEEQDRIIKIMKYIKELSGEGQ